MADIKKELNDIKNAVYGREVRGSIHDGIKKINDEVENITDRQDSVEAQFQSVLDETTGKDVISAPEITAARVGADDTNHPNLKKRLDTEYQKLSSQLADIEQEVSKLDDKKMNRGESISVSQIDKNKGKLDETYMTDEFLQQMAGNTPIHSTPANYSLTSQKFADHAIPPRALSFAKKPNNILHFNNSMRGYTASGTTGEPVENPNAILTDFIEIKPSTPYVTEAVSQTFYYDEAKNYITRTTASQYISHQSAFFARYSCSISDMDKAQVNEGVNLAEYDTPEYVIGGKESRVLVKPTPKSVEKGTIVEGAVEPQNLSFIEKSNNLFNKNKIILNRAIDLDTGGTIHSDTDVVTDYFISVKPNTLYSKSKHAVRVAMYNRQGVFIKSLSINPETQSFVTAKNAEFIKISLLQSSIDEFMLNEGPSLLPYEDYGFIIKSTSDYPIKIDESVFDRRTEVTNDYYVIDPVLNKEYTAPTMESKSSDSDSPLSAMTLDDIYDLYDELMNENPNYITKEYLGDESTGLPIYKYEFKPELPAPTDSSYVTPTKMIKIIITSGTHGVERLGVWLTYLTMKQICENWQDDEVLEALRWNVHFIIIPVVSPWSFVNKTRKNSNGVDINRNFPEGWSESDPSTETYGGPSPLSELESQYVYQVLSGNRDAIYVIDFHNSFGDPYHPKNFVWINISSHFDATMGRFLIGKLSRKWKREHQLLENDGNTFYGYVVMTIAGGSIATQALGLGSRGSTFEVQNRFQLEPNALPYSSLTNTLGVDAFINWLAVVIRNAANK